MPFKLVWRNILAHPIRSVLTFGSVVVAVFLLCVLNATTRALTSTTERATTNRLVVQSAVSLFVDLPLAYESRIATISGVEKICKWQWFGGIYRDPSNFFAQFGVDSTTLSETYPELEIIDGSYEDFTRDRTGCIIGADLVRSYGFKVGDKVPIIGTIFPRAGDAAWEFTVRAVYHANTPRIDQGTLYFHFDYLRESLESGEASGPEGVGVYMLRLAKNADPTRVMADIDALYANGPQRVQTTTESEFARSFITMLGSVPTLLTMIGGAVLFAIFFAVLNTMLMAARERVRDVGIMKALGFTDGKVGGVLVIEALLICGSAGLVAVALAKLAETPTTRMLTKFGVRGFEVSPGTVQTGVLLAVGLGLLAGLVSGWRAARLAPVRALRAQA